MNGCGLAWRKIAVAVAAIMVTFIQIYKRRQVPCCSACLTMNAAAAVSKGQRIVCVPREADTPGTRHPSVVQNASCQIMSARSFYNEPTEGNR